MTDRHHTVRSYQRIFSPERRIHQIEGRPLPVPGGVPLRWLGWAVGALIAVLVLDSNSLFVPAVAAAAAGAGGLILGHRTAWLLAAAAATAGTFVLGALLGILDWPIRLVLVPVAVATAAIQATPDGRRPERFAISWIALRLAPKRRSLGRGLPELGETQTIAFRLWVAPDGHGPRMRRGRVTGPAVVSFREPVEIRRRAPRRRGLLARPARTRHLDSCHTYTRISLDRGEPLEVRP
ncbi:MAG TPA: TcpE family conjugal transfer membrane protein [Solirubrobacterales bacterium]